MAKVFPIAQATGEKYANAVFFHGLGGDAHGTWRNGSDETSFWPAWLAQDIQGLSVYSVGYDAPISRWRGSAMHLIDRAVNVLECLLLEPAPLEGQLVLIGHSLGGLLIKQVLRTAETEARNRGEAANFLARVKKIAFLGTPHTGAGLATCGNRLRILFRPSAATVSLVRNDPYLRELNCWYRSWANSQNITHLILTEGKPLRILGMIVMPDSSDPGLGTVRPKPMDCDHVTICKPLNNTDEIYVQVWNFIRSPGSRLNAPLPKIADGQGPKKKGTHKLPGFIEEKTVKKLLAEMDECGEIARAAEASLERHAVLELARYLKPFDRPRVELQNSVDIALRVIAKGESCTNEDPLVARTLKLCAETTMKGRFDIGPKIVDKALAELDRRDEEWGDTLRRSRNSLLEVGIELDLLRRDPIAAARRIEEIANG